MASLLLPVIYLTFISLMALALLATNVFLAERAARH